jgi:hypothetical protein
MNKSKSKAPKSVPPKKLFKWHAVPLKGSFMVSAILGFFISLYYVYPQSVSYGFAFMVVFAAMFVASLISMTKAPIVKSKDW